jgi:hypothetical protein
LGYDPGVDITNKYAVWYKDSSGEIKAALSEDLTLKKP